MKPKTPTLLPSENSEALLALPLNDVLLAKTGKKEGVLDLGHFSSVPAETKREAVRKAWRQANRNKTAQYCRSWRERNPDYKWEPSKEAAARRKARCAKNAERQRAYSLAWKKRNIEKVREKQRVASRKKRKQQATYMKRRRCSDPLLACKERLQSRIRAVLARNGILKSERTENVLGCPFSTFHAHLEAQFLPGMTWENRNLWHIDHIVPCKAGKTKEQIEALFHFTNLRPLWKASNLEKYAKLPQEHELPANLHPKVREIYLTLRRAQVSKTTP